MISDFTVREEFVGTGSLDTYSFAFKITTLDDLLVIVTDDLFVETFRVDGNDTTYLDSVTFDSDEGGGEIVLTDVLPSGHHLFVIMAVDEPVQTSQFKNKADFTLKRIESAIDYQNTAIQRLAYQVNRCLKIPEYVLDSVAFNSELETLDANYLLGINAGGTRFATLLSLPDFQADVDAAAASAAAALVSETASAASAAAAEVSETNAAASASSASTSATSAAASATSATTSASSASTSATNAAASASSASTSATNAATSATNAATSAAAALSSQVAAANSASAAAVSETNAAASEVAAAASEVAAAASAAAAAALMTVFLHSVITASGAYAPSNANSRFVLFDATLGNQTLTLPAISSANDGLRFTIVKIDATANTVGFTGTVSGEVDPSTDQQYTSRTVIASAGSWYWL